MDSSDFDLQISQFQQELGSLHLEMENTTQQFLGASKPFIINWFRDIAASNVKLQPEITKNLGVEKLTAMKKELEDLCNQIEELVNKYLNIDEIWAHRKNFKQNINETIIAYAIYGNKMPEIIDNALRSLLGCIGKILEKYGYYKKGAWFKPPSSNYYYNFKLDWSQNMKSAITKYSKQNQTNIESSNKLERVKRNKEEFEAKDMWDKI
ncbi:MAG: hypothetical protein Q8940_07350 [Bacteroidota bacterium]|nr:hypothetical protein [Bacteroidota bacterium]